MNNTNQAIKPTMYEYFIKRDFRMFLLIYCD